MLKYFKLIAITTIISAPLLGNCARECCDEPCSFDPCNCNPCTECCNSCCATPCCCEPCDFCPPLPPETCAYNAPMFYDIKCSWDTFVTASFVYAQAKEENLEYVSSVVSDTQVENDPVPDVSNNTDKNGTLSYDYKPGFKVGIGFTFGCDNWNLYTEYFRYHADAGSGNFFNSVSAGSSFMEAFLTQMQIPGSPHIRGRIAEVRASTKWRLEMDIVDFNLRRKYYVGKCLTFQTAIGIKAAWIDQQQTTDYDAQYTPVDTEISLTGTSVSSSDSWAVGAKAALDTDWLFCGSFRLFGNAGFAILYTDYNKIKLSYSADRQEGTNTPTLINRNYSTNLCYLRQDANIALGIGWGDYLCCNDWYLDLSASYEFHTYWNQNVLPVALSRDELSVLQSNGDLYLHGLVITARLDF